MKHSIFINIGFHKTATTWLQNNYFSKQKDIKYLGKSSSIYLSKATKLKNKIIFDSDLSFSKKECKSILDDLINENQIVSEKIYGLSYEGFSAGRDWFGSSPLYVADRIKEIFKDFNVKIIIGIRRQVDIIESIYSEYIKLGGVHSIKKLLFSPYSEGSSLLNKFLYYKFIKYYQDLFGENNVYVYLLEDFQKDQKKVINEIGYFLGIDRVKLIDNKGKSNPRLSRPILYIHRLFNMAVESSMNTTIKLSPICLLAFIIGRIKFIIRLLFKNRIKDYKKRNIKKYKYEQDIHIKVRNTYSSILTKADCYFFNKIFGKYKFSKKLRKYIKSHYKVDNMKLANILENDLKEYGY